MVSRSPHCGSHRSGEQRAWNASVSRAPAAVIAGPSRIRAGGASSTQPTGIQREKTQGHTIPSGEIAAAPWPQWPHNCAVSGAASRIPRPTCRSRSIPMPWTGQAAARFSERAASRPGVSEPSTAKRR